MNECKDNQNMEDDFPNIAPLLQLKDNVQEMEVKAAITALSAGAGWL